MKKSFLILVTLVMMSANVFADGLTATLQQGDKMTPFYGVDAFRDAYVAADSGAVITLSAGKFNDISSIEKPMKIVGNFGLDASSVERTILSALAINANKVTIDGIYFSGDVTLGNINDCKIFHSWVEGTLKYASTESWHTNTVVDQCVIKTETAIKQGKNYTLKNSTIGKFGSINNNNNPANLINNSIFELFPAKETELKHPAVATKYSTSVPVAIYRNNVILFDLSCFNYNNNLYYYYVEFQSPSEFYANTFINTYGKYTVDASFYSGQIRFGAGCINSSNSVLNRTYIFSGYPSLPSNHGEGQDGTLRGPLGGTGFSYYPAIPRIISSNIGTNTDNNGKLNVTIKVSIPQ